MGDVVDEARSTTEVAPDPSGPANPLWAIGVFVVHCVLFAPVVIQAIYHTDRWLGPDDFTGHIHLALPLTFKVWYKPGPPHFVWHVLVKLLSNLTPGRGYLLPSTIVTIAFCGLTGLVWYLVLRIPIMGRRMPPWLAAALSVVLLASEAPDALAGWQTIYGPHYFMPLEAYHNPTGIAARPFLALLLVVYLRVLSTPEDDSRAYRRLKYQLAVIGPVATLTKPSLTMCLIAVTIVLPFVWSRRDGRTPWEVARPLVYWFEIPCSILVFMQFLIIRYQGLGDKHVSVSLQPFRVLSVFGAFSPWFWTVLVLPIVLIAVFGKRLLEDPLVELCLWCFAVGFVVFAVAASPQQMEMGPDAMWLMINPMQLFLLAAARRIYFLRGDGFRVAPGWWVTIATLAALYVFSFGDFTTCELGQACLHR